VLTGVEDAYDRRCEGERNREKCVVVQVAVVSCWGLPDSCAVLSPSICRTHCYGRKTFNPDLPGPPLLCYGKLVPMTPIRQPFGLCASF
jgi:hypothetical protein